MTPAEQTDRERQLEGICESQRLELEDARRAMRQREEPVTGGDHGTRRQPGLEDETVDSTGMPTVEGTAAYLDTHLAVVDEMIRRLQAATDAYRGRQLYRGEVTSLERVRGHLSEAVNGLVRPAPPPS